MTMVRGYNDGIPKNWVSDAPCGIIDSIGPAEIKHLFCFLPKLCVQHLTLLGPWIEDQCSEQDPVEEVLHPHLCSTFWQHGRLLLMQHCQ